MPRVIDGDSLEVAGVSVRLFGIDAPEREQDCRDAAGKTYSCGRSAQRALAAAIAGREVTCTPVDVDQYKRDVSVCTADNGDLGEAMVRGGHALDYTRHSRGRYADAEREAREARRGLWAGIVRATGELASAERDPLETRNPLETRKTTMLRRQTGIGR